MFSPHQQKYIAWELTRKRSASDEDKFTGVLAEAQVDLNPHQVEAALFAFRSPLSMGAILADEVGLGKTIEAALVISQHWAERRRHILIIAPPTLRKQWSAELEEKFFLPSLIIEKKSFNSIITDSYKNPFESNDKIIICSYPFAVKQIQHIQRVKWDLVIMDEAHKLRNVYKNNKTGLVLKTGLLPFKKLLLTATPLQNDIKELYGLISIIDDNYFGGLQSFSNQYNKIAIRDADTYSELRQRIRPLLHRTLRSDVQEFVKYTKRSAMVQEYFPSEIEIELSDAIHNYLQKEESYGLPRSQRNLISLVLFKLLASSSFAIAGTLDTIIKRLEKIIETHNDNQNLTQSINENFEEWDDYSEEWLDEDEEDESEIKAVKEYTPDEICDVAAEIEELKIIHQLALGISTNSKGDCLLKALELGFENMRKMNAPQKALIFTESTRTQQYIQQLLEESGYKDKTLLFNGSNNDPKSKEIFNNWLKNNKETGKITESQTANKRQALVDHFRNDAQIMIATEAAAEGINLQFCSLLVNYDLPWNPQRVEQRIGRCHRYGQKYDVVVINFINKNNRADQRVYELLERKFELFKGVFDASDEVLGSIENTLDFEKRILRIYQQCRTTEEIDEAFNQLEQEMEESISDTIQQTKASLLEHFDEEVINKLRIKKVNQAESLTLYHKLLWLLTRSMLNGSMVVLDEENYKFRLLESKSAKIATGIYSIGTQVENAMVYRITHPLAEELIEKAKITETPFAEITFDYSNHLSKISIVHQNIGNSGWLAVRVIRFSSLNDFEEHLMVIAMNKNGETMDDDFALRLLTIPAINMIESTCDDSSSEKISKLLANKQEVLFDSLETRNGELVTQEIQKIEHWAEDNRKELQRSLGDLDKDIEDKNQEFMRERNIRQKLAIQKEKDIIVEKRDNAWRDYDQKREELKREKNKLIQSLYQLADQQIEVADEFVIGWKVV